VERSSFIGTPSQVADQLQKFVDVGTTWIHVGDLTPMVLEPDDAAQSVRRVIEVSSALKANNAH
jgi:alkanesulfonate monooxygenase SsuD/methylene tetrahydromethanopterin reductase-like flavin-dependent oxidoreductase (luciferase family)